MKINFTAAKEAYEREEMENIGWVKTADKITDAFTESTINEQLEQLMETRQLNQTVFQWILRDSNLIREQVLDKKHE